MMHEEEARALLCTIKKLSSWCASANFHLLVAKGKGIPMNRERHERPTLLIVEDEPSTREAMVELLERDGYLVITAEDETEAVERARRVTPDLIIVELDGTPRRLLSVGERVRAEVKDSGLIPIVAYAAEASDMVCEGGVVSLGDNEYITLPEDFQQLENLISQLLHMRRNES